VRRIQSKLVRCRLDRSIPTRAQPRPRKGPVMDYPRRVAILGGSVMSLRGHKFESRGNLRRHRQAERYACMHNCTHTAHNTTHTTHIRTRMHSCTHARTHMCTEWTTRWSFLAHMIEYRSASTAGYYSWMEIWRTDRMVCALGRGGSRCTSTTGWAGRLGCGQSPA